MLLRAITHSKQRSVSLDEPPPPRGALYFGWAKRQKKFYGVPRGHLIRKFRQEIARIFVERDVANRVLTAQVIPLDRAAPEAFPELVVDTISTVWYLARRYPHFFQDPALYNLYLSIMVRWRLKSVPEIFLRCFSHFSIEGKANKKAKGRHGKWFRWYWPFPTLPNDSIPNIPQPPPRPDKHTFVHAMEYAHFFRDVEFAQVVWDRRKAWRKELDRAARESLETVRWSEVEDKDILRYERDVVEPATSIREWAKWTSNLDEKSDGASNTLYEGYTRLLYIQILAASGKCDVALAMILEGTGERYQWTRAMLQKVEKYAVAFGHKDLCEYIAGLEYSGTEDSIQAAEHDWMEEAWSEKNDSLEDEFTRNETAESESDNNHQAVEDNTRQDW
jgi:hypothetical protein